MALYRTIQISFWTDTKIVDDFTPEDKYFYLYLFTNPHTNLSGCYEISKNQMSLELGYTKEVVDRLINRFKNIHKVIDYDNNTKEIILLNWHKYNWTKSADYKKGLKKEIDKVKNANFKEYLLKILDGGGTVCTPSLDGGGTSNTNTITNTITITNTNNKENQTENAQKIIDLFNKNCPSFLKVAKLTEQRKKTINARLKDYSEEEIIKVFSLAENSKFLTGQNDRNWKANFDWIINPNNFVKILEESYNNEPQTNTNQNIKLTDTQIYAKEHAYLNGSNPDFLKLLEEEEREKSRKPFIDNISGADQGGSG